MSGIAASFLDHGVIMLLLIADFTYHKFIDAAFWFRSVRGVELVGPVGL
jgi:hypothetical protein